MSASLQDTEKGIEKEKEYERGVASDLCVNSNGFRVCGEVVGSFDVHYHRMDVSSATVER